MHWNGLQDFIFMGGYGLYVWGATLAVFASIGIELAGLLWRRKALLRAHAAKAASTNTQRGK